MQDSGMSMIRNELNFVRDMFDRIAPHYDFLNHLLSLRQDVYWRKTLVSSLDLVHGARVLDTACGTADVGIEISRQFGPHVSVVGIDFASKMLRMAMPKLELATSGPQIGLAAADAFDLPFRPEGFDAITMAFGIRNIQDKATILKCFWNQLKPGGRLAILELGTPGQGLARYAYLSYFNRLLPLVGRIFSKHSFAYSYLPNSVARFPAAPEFAKMMRRAGFNQVRYRPLTLGVTVLYVGDKD
jgi:demethylmenaquinone methyltransferase / 2-methoxy-6-polyprenyl-1,4-benzoquinol methylase